MTKKTSLATSFTSALTGLSADKSICSQLSDLTPETIEDIYCWNTLDEFCRNVVSENSKAQGVRQDCLGTTEKIIILFYDFK